MKMCNRCQTSKELSEFHKKSKQPDGLDTCCSACRRADAKRSYMKKHGDGYIPQEERNIKIVDGMKSCSKCSQVKTLDNFYKGSKNASGYRSVCKQCENKATVEYRSKEENKIKRRVSYLKGEFKNDN